jgi:hypothetical protein
MPESGALIAGAAIRVEDAIACSSPTAPRAFSEAHSQARSRARQELSAPCFRDGEAG